MTVDALALAAISRHMAELVTRLLAGETLSRGELMRYGACVGPRFHTPALAALFAKNKAAGPPGKGRFDSGSLAKVR